MKKIGAVDDAGDAGSSSPPDSVENSPFFVTVEAAWAESPDTKTLLKTCAISKGAPAGTLMNCELSVPEGQMYFSDFTITSNSTDVCAISTAEPYQYLASTSTTFDPRWGNGTIDCSGAVSRSKFCYNGPGPDLIPEWPTYDHIFYLPSITKKYAFEIAAGVTGRRGTNRWMCNSLTPARRAVNGPNLVSGDGYIANSMRDWRFRCKDRWEEILYEITLYLSDDDESSGNPDPDDEDANYRADWNSSIDP